MPYKCVSGYIFTVDHAMISKRGGFVIQRHNELRDLEAQLLSAVMLQVRCRLTAVNWSLFFYYSLLSRNYAPAVYVLKKKIYFSLC